MNREYQKWYSTHLQRDMEVLIFGDRGARVILFPTRTARFFDYEDWGMIDAIKDRIEAGYIQVYCVDSVDQESFYSKETSPSLRILKHLQFEQYILQEVLPLSKIKNHDPFVISAGCSLGAYHAINIAFKYPHLFGKAVGMSGRYDLTEKKGYFDDLFEDYKDPTILSNMPSYYIPLVPEGQSLERLRKMEIVLAVGKEDIFLDNNVLLSEMLTKKDIPNSLYVWEEEAHKPWYWKKMFQWYL